MNEQFSEIRDHFLAALEQGGLEAQLQYAAEHCAGDPKLRRELEEMLRAHHQPEGFLASKSAATQLLESVIERPGVTIGPYKLMEQIGEGGMGLVFVAEQHQPVRRKVALKVIKPGMDTRDCLARFEAERQALALMDHPNIARVLDAGATSSGRPYFVMELVKGVPITQYCDENRLAPRERLELFVHVCHAVQHAHQKGIIHRDIKPSNVLVSSHDGHPVVKVIDFGVAKAIGQQLTERTIYTAISQMVGTPLYMSPEQAGMSGLDIDTRTDIYSLGVLLYELLTGTTPFDKERLRRAAYDEMRRIIREEEPQKPSTRISELSSHHAPGDEPGHVTRSVTATLASIAACRHTEPAKLAKLVRGDLDWIVMKALEKDRSRRYETANGFAADVLHYLADEPVLACPPSAGYRLRKFARRNKAALAMAGVVSIALVLTMIGLAVSNVLVRAERNEKETALEQEKKALGEKDVALGAKEEALKQAKTNYDEAKRQEKLARRRFYAAQMNLAMQAWEQGDFARTLELLEGQRPAFDQEDLRGFEWYHLWRNCHLGLRARLTQGPGSIQSVAFFPDGKRLASMGGAALKVWDVETTQEVNSWPNGGGPVVIAPDGKTLACWSQWEPVKLWDTVSGRQLDVFQGTKAAAFAPDGKTIALVRDGDVEFWDLATRERQSVLQKLQGKAADSSPDAVGSFIFSPDGKTGLVTAPARYYAKLCRRDGADWRETTVLPFHGWHLPAAFSPDGALLAMGGEILKLYTADTGEPLAALTGHTANVYSVAFSPDGTRLASAANDRTVRVWDVATRRQQYSYPHPGPVFSVAFSPDGKLLASCGSYETLRVWDAAPSDETSVVKVSRGVRGLAFSPDGRTVAACGDGTVSLIDVDLAQVQKTRPNGANSIAFSHDGRHVALGRRLGRIDLWEMPGSSEPATLEGRTTRVDSVAFSPDDRLLACAGYDGTVEVWDLATRTVRYTLRPGPSPGNPASAVAFSPDGRALATGTLGENVRLWDAQTGRELLVLQQIDREGAGPRCWSVAFSPDSGTLATASTSGQVRLWDTATARLNASLKGHTAAVRCVVFSPDGNTLATAADERAIRLWDTTTGQETIILRGDADKVNAVAFSPDGRTLASGGSDGIVRFWRTSDKPAAVARRTELNPDDPGSPAALVDSATRLQAAGRFPEAQQAWEAARARVAQLAAANPGAADYKLLHAECAFRAGLGLVQAGHAEDSNQGFDASLAALAPLAKEFPGQRRRIAQQYIELGRRAIGNTHVARPDTAFPPAVELFQSLIRESPQDASFRTELASALAYFGVALESRGRRAEAEEPYRQATQLWRELSEEDPGNQWYRHERAYFSLALANMLVAAGRHEDALGPCRVSVELGERNVADFPTGPDHAERLGHARNVLISILSSLGRDEEAAKVKRELEGFVAARAAVVKTRPPEPPAPEPSLDRGWELLREGKLTEAEAEFSNYIRRQPAEAIAHRGLAASLRRQKKLAEAEVQMREAVRLAPFDAWGHEGLGWVLIEQQQPAEAETVFREAIRLQSDLASASYGLGKALREQKRFAESLEPLREGVRLDPNHHYGREMLGWTLLDLKRPAEAETVFRAAARLKPDASSSHAGLGRALLEQSKLVEAEAELREVVRQEPTDYSRHELLGKTLLESKQFAKAEVEFREMIRLNATAASGHYQLANSLRGQNKNAEAIASLREALRLDPSMHYVHDNLGWMYVSSGEFAQAEAEFREEIRLKPDLAAGHFGLARALVEQEKFPDAEGAAREVLRLDPAHRWASGLLNRALKGQGTPPEQQGSGAKAETPK